MVEYIKVLESGKAVAYSLSSLRLDNPNTSFPKKIPNDVLSEYGVYPCVMQDVGSYNEDTHRIIDGEIEKVDGVWTQLRSVKKRSKQEAAAAIREKRKRLLAETDYLALSDTTLTEEVSDYRQSLRDITEHKNFPYLISKDWPAKPEF